MMKTKEMNRICNLEMRHIPTGKNKEVQALFRVTYHSVRLEDLTQNPSMVRRNSFLKSLVQMKKASPEFKINDLNYDMGFFGPAILETAEP